MQDILQKYTSLYEAIGGFVQYDKTSHYSWVWKRINGKKTIKDIEVELKENDRVIDQIPVKIASRILGVFIIPSMNWSK